MRLRKLPKSSYNFIYNLPVRIFWKAASTLVESNAEVSINDNSFFSKNNCKHIYWWVSQNIKGTV